MKALPISTLESENPWPKLRTTGCLPDLSQQELGSPAVERRGVHTALAEAWHLYLTELEAPVAVLNQLKRLEAGAVCIVTGQQAGLLLGPLYTLAKAVRTVALARQLEAETKQPVVPVFWIASDDHDIGEIHHTYAIDQHGELKRYRLPNAEQLRGAARHVPVPAGAGDLLESMVREAGLDPNIAVKFRPQPRDSLARWFARCLLAVTGQLGLVPLEPFLLGRAVQPLFERVLRDPKKFRGALDRGAHRLRNAGFSPPLPVEKDPPVFVIEEQQRRRLRAGNGEYLLGDQPLSLSELLEWTGNGLPRLSANVSMRPLLQSDLLPVVAYVAGPAEALYWAQLLPLHQEFGLPFPAVLPRPSVTVLNHKGVRALRKWGIPPEELLHRVGERPAPAKPPSFLAQGHELEAALDRFLEGLENHSATMKAAVARKGASLRRNLELLLELAAKTHVQGKEGAALRRAGLEPWVRPRGRAQDRVLNALPFLLENGSAFLEALLTLDPERSIEWLLLPD